MVEGSTGIASASPHHAGLGSGTRFAAGDNVVNFIAVRMDGYFVENERTYFVGRVRRSSAYFEIDAGGARRGPGQMREGRRICDIDSAGQEVFERTGYGAPDPAPVRSRHGHRRARVSDRHEFNTRPLGEHGDFLRAVDLRIRAGGFRHSDSVVIGVSEPLRLTNSPTDMDSVIAA